MYSRIYSYCSSCLPIGLALFMYMLFALMFILAKASLAYSTPAFLVGTRMLVSGVMLLAYSFAVKKKSSMRFTKKEWAVVILIAFFNIYLTNALEYIGLQYLTAAKACFIYSFSPYLSALISHWVLKERISFRQWIAMFIAFFGLSFIFLDSGQEIDLLFCFSWGELCLLFATIATVSGWIFMRYLVCRDHSSIVINGWSMLIGGGVSMVHSFITDSWAPVPVKEGGMGMFWVFVLATAFVSNALCYNIYGYLLRTFTATFMSLIGGTTPLFAALFGFLFLGETVGMNFWMAAAFIFPALLFFHSKELQKKWVKQKNRSMATFPQE